MCLAIVYGHPSRLPTRRQRGPLQSGPCVRIPVIPTRSNCDGDCVGWHGGGGTVG